MNTTNTQGQDAWIDALELPEAYTQDGGDMFEDFEYYTEWQLRAFARKAVAQERARAEVALLAGIEIGDPRVEILARAACEWQGIDPNQVLQAKPLKTAWMRHDIQAQRLLEQLAAVEQSKPVAVNIDDMVNRFLGWKLPSTFSPDAGISFKASTHPNGRPIGTNLLTATEARQMFEYVMAQSEAGGVAEPVAWQAKEGFPDGIRKLAPPLDEWVDVSQDLHDELLGDGWPCRALCICAALAAKGGAA